MTTRFQGHLHRPIRVPDVRARDRRARPASEKRLCHRQVRAPPRGPRSRALPSGRAALDRPRGFPAAGVGGPEGDDRGEGVRLGVGAPATWVDRIFPTGGEPEILIYVCVAQHHYRVSIFVGQLQQHCHRGRGLRLHRHVFVPSCRRVRPHPPQHVRHEGAVRPGVAFPRWRQGKQERFWRFLQHVFRLALTFEDSSYYLVQGVTSARAPGLG